MLRFHKQGWRKRGSGRVQRCPGSFDTDAGAHLEEQAMKRSMTTAAAVLLAAFGLATQVQAHDHGNDPRGGQQHGGQAHGWRDRGGHDYRPSWGDRGHDYGRNYRHDYGHTYGHDYGRDHDGWRDHDGHGWGQPYYRDYGYRYPRYYYSRPYYGYDWRYYRPPVYRGSYDCDDYDYDCDDDGFSLLFSLPLRF
jgi:hypothetical protein